jgi:superfamily I DNA and/or RNA helicase
MHALQGSEKDIIILATSISSRSGDFAGEAHRLNVALTRARHHLILTGATSALEAAAPAFQQLIRSCREVPNAWWDSQTTGWQERMVGRLRCEDEAASA